MAQTVHLSLEANGSAVEGDSTLVSLDRENTIECLSYSEGVEVGFETNSTTPEGRARYAPIFITKRIDKSSPILQRALAQNEEINGKFRFFRPNPTGDGTEEHFYTVIIQKGRICSLSRMSPNVAESSTHSLPPTETVGFVFGVINWVYETGGVEHEENVRK